MCALVLLEVVSSVAFAPFFFSIVLRSLFASTFVYLAVFIRLLHVLVAFSRLFWLLLNDVAYFLLLLCFDAVVLPFVAVYFLCAFRSASFLQPFSNV